MDMKFYIASHKNQAVLETSSSGGMFTAFAEKIFEWGGIVIGAVFDANDKKVVHQIAENIHDLKGMRKSKYVWSDYTVCIERLEKAIEENRHILFTGTPCQASLIKRKYGHYEKLYIVDLFCHGTAEPYYFKVYLEETVPQCETIDFRGSNSESMNNFVFQARDKADTLLLDESWKKCLFTGLYVNSAVMRDACFKCPYADAKHHSDITIGDFSDKNIAVKHGIGAKHPSIVAVNSEQGERLLSLVYDNLCISQIADEEKDCVKSYYKRHEEKKGAWGYEKEIKKAFEQDYQSYGFYKAAYRSIYAPFFALFEEVEQKKGNRPVYLYGAGKIGAEMLSLIQKFYPLWEVAGYIETKREHDVINNMAVYSLDEIKSKKDDIYVIVSVTDKWKSEIYKILNENEFAHFI